MDLRDFGMLAVVPWRGGKWVFEAALSRGPGRKGAGDFPSAVDGVGFLALRGRKFDPE